MTPRVSCGRLDLDSFMGSPQLGHAGALLETDLPQAEQLTRDVFVVLVVVETAVLGACWVVARRGTRKKGIQF